MAGRLGGGPRRAVDYPTGSDKSTPRPTPSPSAQSTPNGSGTSFSGGGGGFSDAFKNAPAVGQASGSSGGTLSAEEQRAQAPVFIGWGDPRPPRNDYENDTQPKGRRRPSRVAKTDTVANQKLKFFDWTPQQLREWGEELARLGLIKKADAHNYEVLKREWYAYVEEAATAYFKGKHVTPNDIPYIMVGVKDYNGNDTGLGPDETLGPEAGFTGTKTHVSTDFDLSTPLGAKALVNSVLEGALGRRANQSEFDTFRGLLNAEETANPNITTDTSTYEDDELIGSTSMTTGGMEEGAREQLVLDETMKKPEYGAYQAATTYFNALATAIQSPV